MKNTLKNTKEWNIVVELFKSEEFMVP
jgi:hypothetical protein